MHHLSQIRHLKSTSFRLYFSSFVRNVDLDLTDLTRPHMWYPSARRKKRNVFLHVGPTNSGKTYHALKRLELSDSGIYCGPLRLLAWEVAKRLNKANVPCDLITGQERDEIDGSKHKAVTVEMADVNSECHCAVIDEIQVQYYERLSPLIPLQHPLGSFSDVRKGDCVVTFSRKQIYTFKNRIENERKHLCSVVYGSLPPETRTRQASMFNDDTSEFDVLVASDAIGMGLNLNISRIIFSSLSKFDGVHHRELTVSEIKQIGGRAGRYGSKFPVGEVTCFDADDLPLLHKSLSSPSPVLEHAGLFPTFDLFLLYSRLHSMSKLLPILEDFLEKAKLAPNYFISDCTEMLKIAEVVDELPMDLQDKYLFCVSPAFMDDDIAAQGLVQFAESYSKKRMVRLREVFNPGTVKVPTSHGALKELESIHKVLDLYVWFSFRIESAFPDREVAASQKEICNLLIEEFLKRSVKPRPRLPSRAAEVARHLSTFEKKP